MNLNIYVDIVNTCMSEQYELCKDSRVVCSNIEYSNFFPVTMFYGIGLISFSEMQFNQLMDLWHLILSDMNIKI